MITVRQATPADQEAIFSLIKLAYEGRWQYKIPERWRWEFVENPYWTGPALPIWIAVTENGEVVGQAGAMLEPLQLGGREFRVGWGVDAYVLPEYRQQGIGTRLQEAHYQAHPIFMSLNMSTRIRGIKEELGSKPLKPVATFIKTLQHDPESVRQRLGSRAGPLQRLVEGFLRVSLVDRGLAWTLNRRLARRDAQWRARIDPQIQVRQKDEIDAELDRLWEAVSPHFYALVRRDRTYLEWKYGRQPHIKHKILAAYHRDRICGYLILRAGRDPEPNLGILVDLFASPQDEKTILALIAAACDYLTKQGCKAAVAGTSVSAFQHSLLRLGFRQHREFVPLIHCRQVGPECEEALTSDRWLLGIGDHDWNQFPNARVLFS